MDLHFSKCLFALLFHFCTFAARKRTILVQVAIKKFGSRGVNFLPSLLSLTQLKMHKSCFLSLNNFLCTPIPIFSMLKWANKETGIAEFWCRDMEHVSIHPNVLIQGVAILPLNTTVLSPQKTYIRQDITWQHLLRGAIRDTQVKNVVLLILKMYPFRDKIHKAKATKLFRCDWMSTLSFHFWLSLVCTCYDTSFTLGDPTSGKITA
jgi:hypothetical protein